MAQFSLVGSIGAVSVGALGGAVTPAWGTGESRTAGNLLVCYVAGLQANGAPTTPSGWNKVGGTNVASRVSASIFWLLASGGDAAPTIAALSGVQWAVQLAEFSPAYAAGTIAQDQLTAGAVNASPGVITASGADLTAGDLVLAMAATSYSVSQTVSTGHTLNNGASSTETKNDATSTNYHYNFGYGSTTGNAAADSDSFSFTTTNLTGTNGCIMKLASFNFTATISAADTTATSDAAANVGLNASEASASSETVSSLGLNAGDASLGADAVTFLGLQAVESTASSDTVSGLGLSGVDDSATLEDDVISLGLLAQEVATLRDAVALLGLDVSEIGTAADAVTLIQLSEQGDIAAAADNVVNTVLFAGDTASLTDAEVISILDIVFAIAGQGSTRSASLRGSTRAADKTGTTQSAVGVGVSEEV